MLSMTNVELNFISDVEMYLSFEKTHERVFFIFLKDIAKQSINIENQMIEKTDKIH